MAGFDEGATYYSNVFQANITETSSEYSILHLKFKEFIKSFKYNGFQYVYRDILKENLSTDNNYLTIELKDLYSFDNNLTNRLIENPNDFLPILESAVNDICREICKSDLDEVKEPEDIQIQLNWDTRAKVIKELQSDQIGKLVKINGVVISASSNMVNVTKLTLQCKGCLQYLSNLPVKPGFGELSFPRKCNTSQTNLRVGTGMGAQACPMDPYFQVTDKCTYTDCQYIKMQEAPENVNHGEMPRHLQLFCTGYLCDKVVPGNRVNIVGIPTVMGQGFNKKNPDEVQSSYIRVLGVEIDNTGATRGAIGALKVEEEDEFRQMASSEGIYERLARSIAPGIFGSDDIKKAIVCLLFGGSRKRMSDGLFRRGDINLLMLGDPGTAKSQLLKFVEQVSPIAVYTSGKGSSAAGLTASVIRDSSSGNFVIEGGAMVLADGGVVCIDEFDKMKEDDRVAIHEAMEQQTISVSKAGISTMLNSRCSVLAAANSVFGHWDELKGVENIDFMPTIMSRFDMIFVVKDRHSREKDLQIAKHVLSVHINEGRVDAANDGRMDPNESAIPKDNYIIPMDKLKKYIAFCRTRCGPRLTKEAMKLITNQYVMMRSNVGQFEGERGRQTSIPITVRQMEAIVRIAESLAKMRMASFANESDVEEAIRLFRVSTIDASLTGNLDGVEGFSSQNEMDTIVKLEKSLKKRFIVGSQVSQQMITDDFIKQGYPERIITKVLMIMIGRGEIQSKFQRRLLMRIK